MSSNQPHININRSNYEDFFLLYVDGELKPEECDAVEVFAAAHPDLQEELDILLTTRLDAEPVVFLDKEALMSDSMKTTAIDETILLYIDNELKGEEKAGFEWEMSKNPELQLQHKLLLQTKLDPTEAVVYPNKGELYRRSEKAVRPMYWMRAAAAVVILLGWGSFWYMDNYDTTEGVDPVAVQRPAAPASTASKPATTTIAPEASEQVAAEMPASTPAGNEERTAVPEQPLIASTNINTARTRADYREPVAEPLVVVSDATPDAQVAAERSRVETVAVAPQQNINNQAVTLQTAATYNNIDVPTGDDSRGSIAREDNDKKGSMRGFLRKTARFIERRTGVDPTNEGDELMIGALTISLK